MVVPELRYPIWESERAKEWGRRQPWIIGCNYTPAYATNQFEFWQEDTFDTNAIEAELELAHGIGFNSLRIFLHDQLWSQDKAGFLARLDRFLGMAEKQGIRPLIVFFDSCWHPFPLAGKQRGPEPGVHNSGWVQSPGVVILRDPVRFAALEPYVTGVVSHFRADDRVLGWDVWNEPDNPNTSAYGSRDLGSKKAEIVLPLLAMAFDWIRSQQPTQPVTCGLWQGEWEEDRRNAFHRLQLEGSDIISFHWYNNRESTAQRVALLAPLDRPILCTEYMARGAGSTFEGLLPFFKEQNIGAYNWGFVQGRTQTHLPWDSWQKPYIEEEPEPWFHEIFRSDLTPYRDAEVALLQHLAQKT